jgi:hypothetical protein
MSACVDIWKIWFEFYNLDATDADALLMLLEVLHEVPHIPLLWREKCSLSACQYF